MTATPANRPDHEQRRQRARWLASEILPHERSLRSWLGWRASSVDPDDIVQEAYAVLASLPSVDHIRRPKNYLFQTARSIVLQQARRDRIVSFQVFGATQDPVAQDASPEAASVLRDELRKADQLLAKMPDRVREAFLLRRVEGLSQREIAARMAVSENTVEKHIGKALKLLMQSLREGDGGKPGVEVSTPQKGNAALRERQGHRGS